MKRVIIEHPYAGPVEDNIAYARRCLKDSLTRGESPFASALLYPQVLDDDDPVQRKLGIKVGLRWGEVAELTAVYIDRGVSTGMIFGIRAALECGRTVEIRSLTVGPAITPLVLRPRAGDGTGIPVCGACGKPWDPGHAYANGRVIPFPLPAEAVGFFECPAS